MIGCFSEQFSWQPKLDSLVFYSISMDNTLGLESLFEEVEIFKVVKGMNSDKASGLMVFLTFFQACWDVLKANIMGVFHEFHASSRFEKT